MTHTSLTFKGSSESFVNTIGAATLPGGFIRIAKTGSARVSLSSNVNLGFAGQNLTIQSGVLNLATRTLSVNNVFTIDAGAVLKLNNGSYTPNSGANFVNNGTIDGIADP